VDPEEKEEKVKRKNRKKTIFRLFSRSLFFHSLFHLCIMEAKWWKKDLIVNNGNFKFV